MRKENKELLVSLPDYITGSLNDKKLEMKIKRELSSDSDFKNEYESMKNTFSVLAETEFTDPPAHYFNNLLPNINTRLDGTDAVENKVTFADRLMVFLKFAIPVIVILGVYFIYNQITSNEGEEKITDKNSTIQKETPNETNNKVESEDNNSLTNMTDSTKDVTSDANKNEKTVNTKKKDRVNNQTNNTNTIPDDNEQTNESENLTTNDDVNDEELEEYISETSLYSSGSSGGIEEISYESLENLTEEEQNQILMDLENADL